MDKISIEILLQVFKYLPYEQKHQCKLVCHKWANILRSGFDLETIMIPYISNFPTLRISRAFVKKVQHDNINLGTKCKRLTLCHYHCRAKLASLFPNLDYLCLLPALDDDDDDNNNDDDDNNDDGDNDDKTMLGTSGYDITSQTNHLQNWHYHLKTFIELRFDESLFSFLRSGVFHQLTTLMIHTYWRGTSGKHETLVHTLKNVPNLEMLHLTGGTINIFDLEILHTNVPRLQSLLFHNIRVLSEQDKQVTIPAGTVKRFEVNNCSLQYRFLRGISRYIISKYPNLEQFTFTTSYYEPNQMIEEENITENPWESFFTCLFDSTGSNLKSFKMKIPVEVPQLFTELRKKSGSLEVLETCLFFKKEYLENVLEVIRSNDNIHSLILDEVPPLEFDIFQNLNNLKELDLWFEFTTTNTKYPIEMNILIYSLPKSIEKLSLSRVELYLRSEEEAKFARKSRIKYLKIAHSNVKSDLSDYLSNNFPKLDTIILFRCFLDFDIRLPNHHLNLAHIYLVGIGVHVNGTGIEGRGISKPKCFTKYLKATVGNKTHRYIKDDPVIFYANTFGKDIIDVHDHSMYHVCKPTNLNEEYSYFHFQCASIQTMLYNDYLVLL